MHAYTVVISLNIASMQQKEVKSNPKHPSCKKKCTALKMSIVKSEKRCEIQGGGQEMAVMVG